MIRWLLTIALICACAVIPAEAQKNNSARKNAKTTQPAPKKRVTSKAASAKKGATSKGGNKKTTQSKSRNTKATSPATSAEAKLRQQEAQKEIALTKKKIRQNEAEVKKGLTELNRLNSEINDGKALVAKASQTVASLEAQINNLQTRISSSEARLTKMRADYLASVKKIRTRRNSSSNLAFIFSSKSFSQAMQRMRYLREISNWREKKTTEISDSVKALAQYKSTLEQSKEQKAIALQRQVEAQEKLTGQFKQQDILVSNLRRNGQALNSHLARKQQEANALKATIANLIAQ